MRKREEGIVHFLPLVLIAVFLIGFVGYFSVTRIKDKVSNEVLGNTTSSGEEAFDDDFDDETSELEDIIDLESELPTGVAKPTATPLSTTATPSASSNPNQPVILDMEREPEDFKIEGVSEVKLFGRIPVKVSEDSLFYKIFGFLFSK